jgi:hypothetical protein
VKGASPGEHLLLFSKNPEDALEGRKAGLELRDTLLVLRPGPISSFVFLFRKPIEEGTVAEQMGKTGQGAINIAGCRVGSGGQRSWTAPRDMGFSGGTDVGSRNALLTNLSVGRWPSNLVLVHGEGCKNVGTKKLRGINQPGSVGGLRRTALKPCLLGSASQDVPSPSWTS